MINKILCRHTPQSPRSRAPSPSKSGTARQCSEDTSRFQTPCRAHCFLPPPRSSWRSRTRDSSPRPPCRRGFRFPEETRRFALDSLNHKYGHDTWRVDGVSMDDIENFASLSPIENASASFERSHQWCLLTMLQTNRIYP